MIYVCVCVQVCVLVTSECVHVNIDDQLNVVIVWVIPLQFIPWGLLTQKIPRMEQLIAADGKRTTNG